MSSDPRRPLIPIFPTARIPGLLGTVARWAGAGGLRSAYQPGEHIGPPGLMDMLREEIARQNEAANAPVEEPRGHDMLAARDVTQLGTGAGTPSPTMEGLRMLGLLGKGAASELTRTPGNFIPGATPGQAAMRAMKAEVAAARAGAPEGARMARVAREMDAEAAAARGGSAATSEAPLRRDISAIFEAPTPTPAEHAQHALSNIFEPDVPRLGAAPSRRALPARASTTADRVNWAQVEPWVRGDVVRAWERGYPAAAFLDPKTGKPVPTGGSHDLEAIIDPGTRARIEAVEAEQGGLSGFMDEQGNFLTREQAKQKYNAREGESSEIELAISEARNAQPLPLLGEEPRTVTVYRGEYGSSMKDDPFENVQHGRATPSFAGERSHAEAFTSQAYGQPTRVRRFSIRTSKPFEMPALSDNPRATRAGDMAEKLIAAGIPEDEAWKALGNVNGWNLPNGYKPYGTELREHPDAITSNWQLADSKEITKLAKDAGYDAFHYQGSYSGRGKVENVDEWRPFEREQVTLDEPIPLPPMRAEYTTPGTEEFTQLAKELHDDWKKLDKIGKRRTPEQEAEFEDVNSRLDVMLSQAFLAGKPSPLGYPEPWSRLEAAFNESGMQSGKLAEWLAELRKVAPHGVSDAELYWTLQHPTEDAEGTIAQRRAHAQVMYTLFDAGIDPTTARIPGAITESDWDELNKFMTAQIQGAEDFGAAVRDKVKQLMENERTGIDKKIEGLRRNKNMPEEPYTDKNGNVKPGRKEVIAGLEKRKAELESNHGGDDLWDKARELVRQERAPVLSRQDIADLIGKKPLAVDVETRSSDPRVRVLTKNQYSPQQRRDASVRLQYERDNYRRLQIESSNALDDAISGYSGSDEDGAKERIAAARSPEEAARAVTNAFNATPDQAAKAAYANKLLNDMAQAHGIVAQLEHITDATNRRSTGFDTYLTPYEGEVSSDYTENIYRMRNPKVMPQVHRRQGHAFGIEGEQAEIGWTRRTAEESGDRTFLQEMQSDIAQDLQKGQKVEPGPYHTNLEGASSKDWFDMMLRDQFMRAAAEGRSDIFIQPGETSSYVSGGNDSPELFYRDVAPHNFRRVAAELATYRGMADVNVGGSSGPEPDMDMARDMAEERVSDEPTMYIRYTPQRGLPMSLEDWASREYGNRMRTLPGLTVNWPSAEDIFKRMYVEDHMDDVEWTRYDAENWSKDVREGNVGDAPESFRTWYRDHFTVMGDYNDIVDRVSSWNDDMENLAADEEDGTELTDEEQKMLDSWKYSSTKDLVSDLEQSMRDQQQNDVEYTLEEDANTAFQEAREAAVDEEADYIYENWSDYFDNYGEDAKSGSYKVPFGSFTFGDDLQKLFELQKKGTYLLGPAAVATGVALASRKRRKSLLPH